MTTKSPIQRIIFGSPATGKSYLIDNEIIKGELKILESENIIKTVFHPEYTYGDFMGKLVPHTKGEKVTYKFHEGHFLKALAQAYKNILENPENPKNVALVIDEINRGNSSAIFGTVFQLLDRNPDGWSSYAINITELEMLKILELVGVTTKLLAGDKVEYRFKGMETENYESLKGFENTKINLKNRQIQLPHNLSILGTMNISDHSIYFMDNAFKRRWEWEFVEIKDQRQLETVKDWKISLNGQKFDWTIFIDNLNEFIKAQHEHIRNVEDKQIGYRFINKAQILETDIKNKLMFFVWDSVFTNNKKPLSDFLGEEKILVFGDFAKKAADFVDKIYEYEPKNL